nr:LuxR C-terminal-related transcriptional regulator [Actinomyces wuliandei]
MTNKQIARRLTLSQATVKAHVSAIIAKLGVRDRVGAVVYALNNHLL